MKPCLIYRKRIGRLALHAVNARQEQAVRAHLATRSACRAYWEQLSGLTDRLEALEARSDIESSEFFHQGVLARLAATPPGRAWSAPASRLGSRVFRWPFAFPIVATLLLMVGLAFLRWQPQRVPPVAPARVARTTDRHNLPPTLCNYQRIANRSPDELDQLMVEQGNRNPPGTDAWLSASRAGLVD